MSARLSILTEIRSRVQAIAPTGGFQTDAGAAVFLNELPDLGEGDPEVAIAIVLGTDAVTFVGENVSLELPIDICALAKADLDEPWLAVEAVIADIKKAVELPDRLLGGWLRKPGLVRRPTSTLARETGTTTVGAVVRYLAPYLEKWGVP